MENDYKKEVLDFFNSDPRELKPETEAQEIVNASDYKGPKPVYKIMRELDKRAAAGYDKVVHDIRAKVRDNNDVIICIDGDEGVGKSFFGMKLAKDLDAAFGLTTSVLFRPTEEQLRDSLFNKVKQYGVGMVDEAMDVMYKRRAMTSENIRLNQLFAKIRKFNRIVILILPSFYDLDPFFRQRRVKVRISIIERGLGFCMISSKIEGNNDPWFFDYNKKIMEEEIAHQKVTYLDSYEKLAMYEQYRCFFCPIVWSLDDVAPELWADYERMAKAANEKAEAELAKQEQDLNVYEKRYRSLFVTLARHYMLKMHMEFKDFFKLLAELYKGTPPITETTAKKFLIERPNVPEPRKKIDMEVFE